MNQGWICPTCGKASAPWVPSCAHVELVMWSYSGTTGKPAYVEGFRAKPEAYTPGWDWTCGEQRSRESIPPQSAQSQMDWDEANHIDTDDAKKFKKRYPELQGAYWKPRDAKGEV